MALNLSSLDLEMAIKAADKAADRIERERAQLVRDDGTLRYSQTEDRELRERLAKEEAEAKAAVLETRAQTEAEWVKQEARIRAELKAAEDVSTWFEYSTDRRELSDRLPVVAAQVAALGDNDLLAQLEAITVAGDNVTRAAWLLAAGPRWAAAGGGAFGDLPYVVDYLFNTGTMPGDARGNTPGQVIRFTEIMGNLRSAAMTDSARAKLEALQDQLARFEPARVAMYRKRSKLEEAAARATVTAGVNF